MMIAVDHSSSMTGVVDSTGRSKWRIARDAVSALAGTYESRIDLGLNVFPNPAACSPGTTLIAPGPRNAHQISGALPGPPPETGNHTPIAQTIRAIINDPMMNAQTHRPAILLVTDGWQWCSPYDADTRFTPVAEVAEAVRRGVAVYVVGFGAEVDVLTLNRMAQAAGTQLAGCDPTGSTLGAPNKCYYQANTGTMLNTALDLISMKVSAEACNGVDDNCDGQIDENLTRNCASVCGGGTSTCRMGFWLNCDAPMPKAEVCDGRDNDCNGATDEGCSCAAGQTRACGPCAAAQQGTQTCDGQGVWGPCGGATMPSAEVCNGLDDDCDGTVDNGVPSSLCLSGICEADGVCRESFTGTDDNSGVDDGCGCNVGAASVSSRSSITAVFMLLALLGTLIFSRSRFR